MDKERLLATITRRLRELDITAKEASKAAVGTSSYIYDIRRASRHNLTLENLEMLADFLGLELYLGDPPETGEIEGVGFEDEFVRVSRIDAEVSAGAGANNEMAEMIGAMAFPRSWLAAIPVRPNEASLVLVRGESMEPTLRDGDLVLIDRRRSAVRNHRIYAFNDIDGDTRVKRLELKRGGPLLLRSDNPDFEIDIRQDEDMNRIAIIGEVVWSAHTWKGG